MLAQRNLQLRLFASDRPGVGSAYDKFVERGDPPAVNRIKDFISGVFKTSVLLNELLDIGTSADTAYDGLASATSSAARSGTRCPR